MNTLRRLFAFLFLLWGVVACQESPDKLAATPAPEDGARVINYPLFGSSQVGRLQDGVLTVQDEDGSTRTLIDDVQVTDMGWFPGGAQAAYTAVTSIGSYQLGIVDVATGERVLLQTFSEPVRAPHPSGDGRYLSIIAGTGETNGCVVDRRLLIMPLGDQQQIVATLTIADFDGIVTSPDAPLYAVTDGNWLDNRTLSVLLRSVCEGEGETAVPSGGYVLNVDLQQAAPISNEP